jgi:hypothetical protein
MMSSATSIDAPGLRPWQFFVLAGMLSATAVVVVATGQSAASIITLSLTVVSASLVAIGAYRALSPLFHTEAEETPVMVSGRTRAALEREKTLVLRTIKELEFDFAMGKVGKGDFEEMSGRLRARAIGLMRQLDAGGSYRVQIEQEVHKRLDAGSVSTEGAVGLAVTEGAAAAAPADIADTTSCPSCSGPNDSDARFCKHCGHKLAA